MPAITFGGIGSGMDVESLIDGLVSISRQPISRIQSRAAAARSAVTELSDIGGLLSDLKAAAEELDTLQEVGSYSATTSNEDAVALSTNGFAQPGTYDVNVIQLAQSDRRYSNAFNATNQGLGQNGVLTLQIGTGDLQDPDSNILIGAETASFDISADHTLDDVVSMINASDLRVQASTFFDGQQHRLQVRGLDTGTDNALTVDEAGTSFGLTDPANFAQTAQDALIEVDGFAVTSANNQIAQSIPGVTLALKEVTSEPFTINIDQDPDALAEKLETFVSGYNEIITKLHSVTGYGDARASNPTLAGDSALRRVERQLSDNLTKTFGTGATNTLASFGIRLQNNGSLKLDRAQLDSALAKDPTAITDVLAGDEDTAGFMDLIADTLDLLTDPSDGALAVRKESLENRAESFDDSIARHERRAERLEEQLRKTFTHMDGEVASYNAQLQYLVNQ